MCLGCVPGGFNNALLVHPPDNIPPMEPNIETHKEYYSGH